jgi:hypothetical protein
MRQGADRASRQRRGPLVSRPVGVRWRYGMHAVVTRLRGWRKLELRHPRNLKQVGEPGTGSPSWPALPMTSGCYS